MELKITNLTCPRIGNESDGLQWEIIRNMLQNTFRNSIIKVCVYTRDELTEDQKIQKIRELHENPLGGHHGLTRTFKKLYEEHNWKGMRKQIKQFIKHCPDCQKNKTATRTPKEPMVITSTANRAFEKILLDVAGPLPRTHSGNSFILTLQDDLIKFAWASPMENHEAKTVAQHFVTKFVCLHGIPQILVTDCGTEFLSNVFKESNGSLERSHCSLAEYLRNFIGKDQINWDTRIPYAMFCHNSTVHSATKFQPYHLVYGNSVKIPTSLTNESEPQYNYNDYQYEVKRQMQEAQALARSNLLEEKSKSKEQYDKTAKHQSFEVGQKVLLQEKAPENKLAPKWLGPYEILDNNTSIPRIIILIMWIWDSTSEAHENYNVTTFPDHKGFYYESHGMIKTSHATWDLVTYVDIKILTTNYDKLMTQYIVMETICKQMIANFYNAEIEDICNQLLHQFSTTTRPYLYEIQINRRNAMLSIEHNSNNEIRNRRGLGGTFKRLINVLYGAYSKINTEFIFKQILELTKNKIQNINLVKEKTRVVQAEILDANHTLQEVTEHHQKLENNLRYLQGLTKESIVNINRLEFKNKLLE
ncbi:hypothetical protein QTP88_001310 [Uroleucon formosanum]